MITKQQVQQAEAMKGSGISYKTIASYLKVSIKELRYGRKLYSNN